MGKRKQIIALLLSLLLAVMALSAAAEEAIITDRDCDLTIVYAHEESAIPGAAFSVYRVADTDEYAHMTVTSQFAPYAPDLTGRDEEEWLSLALTLKGYAQRDGLKPYLTGMTDAKGRIRMDLKPGLYLIYSDGKTTVGDEEYVSDPFMSFLPVWNNDLHEMEYSVTASPKNTSYTIALKVLKKWDDKGFESARPTSVNVTLLRDGEAYETVELNRENGWKYDFSGLDPNGEYEWSVVEEEQEDYTQKITREGTTFVITNTRREPDVVKKITGDKPAQTSEFIFVLKAQEPSNPMPSGSSAGMCELKCRGAGGVNYRIDFETPGTYVYTLEEKDTGISGYTYDKTVYTLTYTVSRAEGSEKADVRLEIRDQSGKECAKLSFTNKYAAGEGKLPQTGQLWWPVPALLAAGLALILIGIVRRRGHADEE